MAQSRPRVVIVGAGFGGLWAAKALAGKPVDVLLIDRNNYHTFFPLLYQVAAAELDPGDIVYPVRTILRRMKNVEFRLGEVLSVDFVARNLQTSAGVLNYDYLILALGSASYYFGVPGAQEHAFALRSMPEAIALRNHILRCFESASHEADEAARWRLLTFTIVGGGATGVEFAGALQELIRRPLARDFPALDMNEVRVMLLEAQGRLLPLLPQRLGEYAAARLRRMGVEVRFGAQVVEVTADSIRLGNGENIETATVAWTAGVRGQPDAERWGLPVAQNGQVQVLPTLQVPAHQNVYVAGDLARFGEENAPLPLVAQVALQQGQRAAANLLRQVREEPPLPFVYRDLGIMAVIGRNAAVAHLFRRWSITGFPAWALWLAIHLTWLIGFRNRLVVLLNWAWDYLFFERVLRLILP